MSTDIDLQHGVINGETTQTPSIGLASEALPDVQQPCPDKGSPTGVSTRNALSSTHKKHHWYVLRATYGRELKAYQDITEDHGTAFCPTVIEQQIINGKRKAIEVSRFPNILFAFGTEEEIQKYVYDKKRYPYLRFYYRHRHEGQRIIKEPLIVPDSQMRSLQIICYSEANDIVLIPQEAITKFQQGEHVRITEGTFAGVEGYVARFYGQQRVAVIIEGLASIATAYVPNAFLKKI